MVTSLEDEWETLCIRIPSAWKRKYVWCIALSRIYRHLIYQPPVRQSVLIYHAGTGRTVFVGALKITTIFLFFANMLIVEPAVASKSSLPWWMAPFG